jgi:hypothetical protein
MTTNDEKWLEYYIRQTGAVAGTVHRHEKDGLRLTAAQNIPPQVREVVAWVPAGKGMAGQALVTAKPVFTCNLRDDPSAAVRPGARAVDAKAAVALPVADVDGAIKAVIGIAYADSREFSRQDLDELTRLASSMLSESGSM